MRRTFQWNLTVNSRSKARSVHYNVIEHNVIVPKGMVSQYPSEMNRIRNEYMFKLIE